MDLHLTSNHDGTSNGFIVTKHEICMVVNDHLYSFKKDKDGSRMIDMILQGALVGDTYENVTNNIVNSLCKRGSECEQISSR